MLVGLTYDLKDDYQALGYSKEEIAELDASLTIDTIEKTLIDLGYKTERIGNISSLVNMLASGKRWDIVFNIAEGFHGTTREAQIPALLEAYRIPFTFSDSMVLAVTLDKHLTKILVHTHGVPTPPFALAKELKEAERVKIAYPLFVKPVAEGSGKGIGDYSLVRNKEELLNSCKLLLNKFKQPVLIEKYLPGKEFTVGIWGNGDKTEALAVMEVLFSENLENKIYSYDTKQDYKARVKYKLVAGDVADKCAKVALNAWKVLGCRDAGRVDIRMDENDNPNFLEVNPLAGLNPADSDLPIMCQLKRIEYNILIKTIIESALTRQRERSENEKC